MFWICNSPMVAWTECLSSVLPIWTSIAVNDWNIYHFTTCLAFPYKCQCRPFSSWFQWKARSTGRFSWLCGILCAMESRSLLGKCNSEKGLFIFFLSSKIKIATEMSSYHQFPLHPNTVPKTHVCISKEEGKRRDSQQKTMFAAVTFRGLNKWRDLFFLINKKDRCSWCGS